MAGEGARGDTPHYNQIRRQNINGVEVEMIHQTLPGDCVLINYLNTESLVNGEGKIAMSPRELRDIVIQRRRQEGESVEDILNDNTPLSYKDVIRLFQTVYNVSPKQEDVVLVGAERLTRDELKNNITHGLLEYLDSYESGLVTTGMGFHSRTIWKLADNNYIVIDPMNPNGFERLNKTTLIDYLVNLCQGQTSENNFFFFLRANAEE